MENSIDINVKDYGLNPSENFSTKAFVDTKFIKKESLNKLSKNWGKAFFIVGLKISFMVLNFILGFFTFFLTNENSFIFDYIPLGLLNLLNSSKQYNRLILFLVCQFLSIFLYIFYIPLNYGVLRWFYNLAKYGNSDFLTVFYYYKNIKNIFITFLFKIVMFLRFLFFGLIFLLPGFSLFLFSCIKMQTVNENKKFLFSLSVLEMLIFFVCGIFLFIKFSAKYFLMPFLQVTNDENIFKNTKRSISIMNSNEEYFGKVFFSFFLWLPLQIFVLPMFFVFPYTTMAMSLALVNKVKK